MIDLIINGLIKRSDQQLKNLQDNYGCLRSSGIEISDVVDFKEVYEFVIRFIEKHSDYPSYDLLANYFTSDEIKDWIDLLKNKPFLIANDYKQIVQETKQKIEDQRFSALLIDAAQIASGGKDVGVGRNRKKLSGVRDAQTFIENSLPRISLSRGSEVKDAVSFIQNMRENYVEVRDNKNSAVGILTGIEKIDLNTYGCKPGELVLVAGFKGEGKSTFCVNWMYTAARINNYNVFYVPLEMGNDSIMMDLVTIHSSHPKFSGVCHPLKIENIQRGLLTPEEEDFYMNHVLKDFEEDSRNVGQIIMWQPDKKVSIPEIKREAERVNLHVPIDMIVIDYIGLVGAPGYKDYSEEQNEILRECKRLAMTFDHGRKVVVVSPFQANRKGKEYADAHNGVYVTSCLSYANEAEKSADLIMYIYVNEALKAKNEMFIGNLKNRFHGEFEKFTVYADFPYRLIRDLSDKAFDPMNLLEDVEL